MNLVTCKTLEEYNECIRATKEQGVSDVTPLVGYAQALDIKPLNQLLDDLYNSHHTKIVELDAVDHEYQVTFLSDMDSEEVKKMLRFKVSNKAIKKVSELVV